MDEATMTRVAQRVKARLRGVEGLRFEVDELGDATSIGSVGGKAYEVPWPDFGLDPDLDLLVQAICDDWSHRGATALSELVLLSDLSVVLNGHELRVAEQQQRVTATPRVKLDPAEAYTAEEAEADVARVARALADYEPGGPWPDEAACVAASRRDAALLLSKLHGWKRGAPPSSAGHHHARRVFEDPTLEALAAPSDGQVLVRHPDGNRYEDPPAETPTWTYTIEDAEADIEAMHRSLYPVHGRWFSQPAEIRHAAQVLLKLSPWRAAVPAGSPGLAHVRTVAGGER